MGALAMRCACRVVWSGRSMTVGLHTGTRAGACMTAGGAPWCCGMRCHVCVCGIHASNVPSPIAIMRAYRLSGCAPCDKNTHNWLHAMSFVPFGSFTHHAHTA